MTARQDKLLLAGALLLWLVSGIVEVSAAMPLSHDEAQYVLGAERILSGAPPLYLYCSVGIEILAMPGVLADSVPVMRICFLVVTLLVPLGGYALARAAFPDRRIAGLVAMALAGSHQMITQNTGILGDLPATGAMLFGLAIVIRELSRPVGPSFWILAAGPLFAVAFYVRYGSVFALAAIILAVSIAYRRSISRRPLPVIALVLVGGVSLVPHLWSSMNHFGSLLGVIDDESSRLTVQGTTGRGLVTYLTSNPLAYFGIVVTPLALVGVGSGIALGRAPARILAFVACATLVTLGLVTDAQPRYAFPTVAMLVVLGVAGLDQIAQRLRPQQMHIYAFAVTAIIVGSGLGALVYAATTGTERAKRRAVIVSLAETLRRDAAGRPCVFIAVRQPQLAYYSGCEGDGWPQRLGTPSCRRTYLVPLPGHPLDIYADGGRPTIPLGAAGIRILECPIE